MENVHPQPKFRDDDVRAFHEASLRALGEALHI